MLGCVSENQKGREFTKDDVKILKCLLDLVQIGSESEVGVGQRYLLECHV